MKSIKKSTIKCLLNLEEYLYKKTNQQLLNDEQEWSNYIGRLILQDYLLLQKQNQKKIKKDFPSSRKTL